MKLDDRILQGGLDIFREKGVKFTMDDLANHLGMSKRTVYEQVSSKEQLLLDTIDTVFAKIKECEREIFEDKSLDDVERLKELISVLPQSFSTIAYTRIYEVKRFYPKVYNRIKEHLDAGWDQTLSLLDECMRNGLVKQVNPLLIKHMIIGCINELLENDFLYSKNMDYKDTYRKVVDIIFTGIENR